MKTVEWFVLPVVCCAAMCSAMAAPVADAPAKQPSGKAEQRPPDISVNILPARLTPGELGLPGTPALTFVWEDKNGENYAVLCETSAKVPPRGEGDEERVSKSLYVLHSARKAPGGPFQTLRLLQDHVKDCIFDVDMRFIPEAVGVTDLDGNGYGEVTVMYKMGCRSDISPVELKLAVLENGSKWILRGETEVDTGDGSLIGGKYTPDSDFAKAPKAIQDHCFSLWRKHAREKF